MRLHIFYLIIFLSSFRTPHSFAKDFVSLNLGARLDQTAEKIAGADQEWSGQGATTFGLALETQWNHWVQSSTGVQYFNSIVQKDYEKKALTERSTHLQLPLSLYGFPYSWIQPELGAYLNITLSQVRTEYQNIESTQSSLEMNRYPFDFGALMGFRIQTYQDEQFRASFRVRSFRSVWDQSRSFQSIRHTHGLEFALSMSYII